MRTSWFSVMWDISPLVLAAMYAVSRRKNKKQRAFLGRLMQQGRVSAEELSGNGLDIPPLPDVPEAPQYVERDGYLVPADFAAPRASAEEKSAPAEKWDSLPEQPETERLLPPLQGESAPPLPKPVRKRPEVHISAISVMLAVGVILVVVAGLLFVRTNWNTLTDTGRLAMLAAGSVLFFGASALARRVWKLERTGMAFFTIGTAFAPISIWAAGYFGLLGETLSGAANKWTITIALAVFSVISLIAVRLYRMVGWGAATLCGSHAALLYLVYALDDSRKAVLLTAAISALLLAFSAKWFAGRMPEPIGKAVVPFSLGYAIFASCLQFTQIEQPHSGITAAAALICAAVWLSPVICGLLRSFAAIPFGIMSVYGFTYLLYPLNDIVEPELWAFSESTWFALSAIISTAAAAVLMLTKAVPENARRGFGILTYLLGGITVLCVLDADSNLPLVIALTLLFLLTLIPALTKQPEGKRIPQIAAAVAAGILCFSINGLLVIEKLTGLNPAESDLLTAGMYLLFGCGFLACKRLHSSFAGILFPVLVLGFSASSADHSTTTTAILACAVAMVTGTAVFQWFAALHHDEVKPFRLMNAFMMPVSLMLACWLAAIRIKPSVQSLWTPFIIWSVVSVVFGALTFYTAQKQFSVTRKILFGLLTVPPMLCAFVAETVQRSGWMLAEQAFAVITAVWLWRMFASHGFRRLSIASAGAGLFLLTEMTAYGAAYLYHQRYSVSYFTYTVFMTAMVWAVLLGILAFFIRRRTVFFVGSDALADMMEAAAPTLAIFLGWRLFDMSADEWHPVFFVSALAMCVLGWILTKPESILSSGASAFAVILALENARQQAVKPTAGHIVLVVVAALILTLLLPYLGIVMRENKEEPAQRKRGWVMTVFGGVIPVWLAVASSDFGAVNYSNTQQRWMFFFAPILAAGYLLHWRFVVNADNTKRTLGAAAMGLFTLAMWCQPLLHVNGTYWENKLHLLPLIAFGVVIRHLYGAETGSRFLFGIGIYSMLRLGYAAIITETTPDLLTVTIAAMMLFVLSFWFKQKKWFLLGGISLICVAVYLHKKLLHGIQWWVYLLLIGVVLIAIAAVNETMKQRGESLKVKAGRFWQDWQW